METSKGHEPKKKPTVRTLGEGRRIRTTSYPKKTTRQNPGDQLSASFHSKTLPPVFKRTKPKIWSTSSPQNGTNNKPCHRHITCSKPKASSIGGRCVHFGAEPIHLWRHSCCVLFWASAGILPMDASAAQDICTDSWGFYLLSMIDSNRS
ncbi:hypothetical protein NECAME_09443 [Necator americanus]|uniref:Uncharacterized protein n=1 Tax=Necator americanus TaxID=51031 RepID=W2TFV4_NECAM|nr:hypothetical protein NECAME_09443 [Necator americanus]ETN80076.1 hypothetical protein NECAME_09443 [Necator americanus]